MKLTKQQISPARVEVLPSFILAGISTITTNEAELSGNGKLAKLFEQFYSNNITELLADHTVKRGHYSCYFNYEQGDAGEYEVLVSVEVSNDSHKQLPEFTSSFTVPSATYAVFVTERGPIIEMIQKAWADIWQWSQHSGFERTFTGDFEYYEPNTNPNDGQVEIYIAIQP